MNRLREKYESEIVPDLMKKFGLSNNMAVPKIKKIVVNAGIGPFRENTEAVDSFAEEFAAVVGQKPYPRQARLSEAGFKIKKGDVVGYSATLRGERMWAFLDKLINIALPRVRDFRGLGPDSFDDHGNYSIGIREHVIFPEVNPNTTKGIRSMQVTVVTNSKDLEQNKMLLEELGMPFKKDR
jgi:large subunit ribosomal protein L5